MFTTTDFDKLQQIMGESPQKKELIEKLLDSHKMTLRTMSHEIRNPLTLVYSTLQLLEQQHSELITYKHWNSMREDVEYMKLLLEELSSYNNGEQLSLSDFNVGTFLKTIVLSFASSLIDTDISFTSRIDPELPVITADDVKLKEVILNLLRNAKEAVASDGSITLCAYQKDAHLHIEIQDNGCGIEEEALLHIFEPFVTYKQGGTGLGLAISKQVALAHGGSLTAFSKRNDVTTFLLTLPIQQNTK